DLESKDKEYDQVQLLVAAQYGHEAVVELLLNKGADLETKDKNGQTPFLRAAEGGHKAVVELLLDKGADLETKGKNGRTP
ncbi:ankyrin, partial [Bimuria novae-zelandiae CBS 107.79]